MEGKKKWRDTGRQEAIDKAKASPFRAFVGSVTGGAGLGAVAGMLSGAIAGLVAGRMHLGLTVFSRGVGVGSVLGAAVSAASFTSEGRFSTNKAPAPEPGGVAVERSAAMTKRELMDQLESLRKRERESGAALDDAKLEMKRRIRSASD